MTMGLVGDEAATAGAAYLMPGGGTYDEELAHYRGNEARFREDYPGLSLAADLVGAVLPGLGWAGAAKAGANLATRAIASGLLGLTGGATQGFMEGEGELTPRIENALLPAALGGGPGAAAVRRAELVMGTEGVATDLVARAVGRDAPYAGPIVAEGLGTGRHEDRLMGLMETIKAQMAAYQALVAALLALDPERLSLRTVLRIIEDLAAIADTVEVQH